MTKVHIHLWAAISNTQDICGRFVDNFKEWRDHSSLLYLHESDSSSFEIFEDMELRLFSESLQMLENTILMAEENSVLYVKYEPFDDRSTVNLILSPDWMRSLSQELFPMWSGPQYCPERMNHFQQR